LPDEVTIEWEARLARAAVAGDQSAFAQLIDHHDERLRGLAFRLLADVDAMDEALQEAYMKAYRALSGFNQDASFGTWLYRIVYTTCIDRLRSQSRHSTAACAGDKIAPPVLADPADQFESDADLAAALQALSPEQRTAVLLIDRDGFSYAEAAEVLGVPLGTVASRVHTARDSLRRCLATLLESSC
jgi:RNA polymerase sigma-70 factor (ECF subfamily)